jgi:hypothetical protein
MSVRQPLPCPPWLPPLLFALWLAPAALAYAQPVEPVQGFDAAPLAQARLAQLEPDIRPIPWFQNWDLWVWTETGRFLHLQFLTSSPGMGIELQGTARLLVVDPDALNDGRTTEGVHRADRGFNGQRGDWGWDPDNTLDVWWHDCRLRGDGDTFEVAMRGRDRQVWLEGQLVAEAPLWQPGSGLASFGWDRRTTWSVQVLPRLRFEGRLNTRGTPDEEAGWESLHGVAVLQHSHTNDFPYAIGQRWIRFRAIRPDGLTLHMEHILTPEAHGSVPLAWAVVTLHGEVIFQSTDVELQIDALEDIRPDSRRRYLVPTQWSFVARNGADTLSVQVSDQVRVSSEDPFRQLERWIRVLLANLLSPNDFEATLRYDAHLSFRGRDAAIAGRGWGSFSYPRSASLEP